MLATRVLTAVILVPLVLAALFLLPPLWLGRGVARRDRRRAPPSGRASPDAASPPGGSCSCSARCCSASNLLLSPASGFARGWPAGIVLSVCGVATVFWLVVAPPWLAVRWKATSPLAMAIVGWIVLIGAWVAVVELQARSPWLVLAAMAIVWIADTAAYFTGRAFGKRRLAPEVSPGKTWEGVYGALAAVAVYALLLVPLAAAGGYPDAVSPLPSRSGSCSRSGSPRCRSWVTSSNRCSSARRA